MSTAVSVPEMQGVPAQVDGRVNLWTSGPAIVLYLAAFKLLLHLLVAQRYNYMQDELYFFACSEHLDWGYVDHPPLIVFITKAVRMLLGDSLFAIRLLPAIAGAALVVLTGAIARTLGGGRFAQALAALGVIALPMYLTVHYVFSMNSIEPLFWTGLAYIVLLTVKGGDPRLLIWAGILVGLGLLNKYSMAIFTLALALGLLFTEHRKLLLSKWLWMGMGIGFLIFAPHLNWLIVHHFPFLEWQHNIKNTDQLVEHNPLTFILQEIFLTGMATLVWLPGVVFFFWTSKGKPYRFLGWAFVLTSAIFILLHGKTYYPAAAFAIAIAGGAVVLEQATVNSGWRRFRPVLVSLIIAGTALLAPMYIPVLPVETLLHYEDAIGMRPFQDEAYMKGSPLSVWLESQFGWQTLVAKVASVYDNLPADDRRRAAIFGRTYPDAAAIDFFGKQYGLPKAISGHLAYYLWGPGKNTSDVVITVGYPLEAIAPFCGEAEVRAQVHDPYSFGDMNNNPVVVCRGLKVDLQTQWDQFKLWY